MKKYEKHISLKQILHSLFRHCFFSLVIVIGFVGIGIGYAAFTKSSNAYSTAKLVNSIAFEQTRMTTVKNAIDSYDFCKKVEDELKNDGVKHSNGSLISYSEIQKGLIYPEYSSETTSNYYEIIYKNSDYSVSKPVLNKVIEQAVLSLSKISTFSDIKIGSTASEPQIVVVDNKQAIVLFACIGVVAAFAASVLFDVSRDNVYDGYELAFLDGEIAESKRHTRIFDYGKKANKKRRHILSEWSTSDDMNAFFTSLHSNVEIYGSSKLLCIVSPNDYDFSFLFAKSFAEFYASKCRKTLLINLEYNKNDYYGDKHTSIESFVLDDEKAENVFENTENPTAVDYSKLLKNVMPNLDVLNTYKGVDSIESVKTDGFKKFIEISKTKYKQIIIVVPSISTNKEIMLLEPYFTSLVIACESSITKKQDIFETIELLKQSNLPKPNVALIR